MKLFDQKRRNRRLLKCQVRQWFGIEESNGDFFVNKPVDASAIQVIDCRVFFDTFEYAEDNGKVMLSNKFNIDGAEYLIYSIHKKGVLNEENNN